MPLNLDDTPLALTVAEVAVALRVSEYAVRQAAKNGTLPCLRVGKLLRFPASKLKAMLETGNTGVEGNDTGNLRAEGEFVGSNSPSNAKARNVHARAKTPTLISTK